MEGDLILIQGVKRIWIDGKKLPDGRIDFQMDTSLGQMDRQNFYLDKWQAIAIINQLKKSFEL